MKRNYLVNSIYMTIILCVFIGFKMLGYSSAAMLRQDIIFYILYFPFNTIILVFGLFYIIFKTNWKGNFKGVVTSCVSIITTIVLFVMSVILPDIYDTWGLGLQILVFAIIIVSIIANMIFVHIGNNKVLEDKEI